MMPLANTRLLSPSIILSTTGVPIPVPSFPGKGEWETDGGGSVTGCR